MPKNESSVNLPVRLNSDIEYEEKQKQTKSVVSDETQVKLAKQDKVKQLFALEAENSSSTGDLQFELDA